MSLLDCLSVRQGAKKKKERRKDGEEGRGEGNPLLGPAQKPYFLAAPSWFYRFSPPNTLFKTTAITPNIHTYSIPSSFKKLCQKRETKVWTSSILRSRQRWWMIGQTSVTHRSEGGFRIAWHSEHTVSPEQAVPS